MNLNAPFAFAIKGLASYTFHNGFKKTDGGTVYDENAFKQFITGLAVRYSGFVIDGIVCHTQPQKKPRHAGHWPR